jgi:hypothetical protein
VGGGTNQTTRQKTELPAELQPLTRASAERVMALQDQAPVAPFLAQTPQRVPGLSATQQRGVAEIPGLFDLAGRKVTGANLESSPSMRAARQAFTTAIEPRIVNQQTLAGLGRSTAVPGALAQAEAQYLTPLIESELAREERGLERESGQRLGAINAALTGGGLERGVEQERAAAEQQDMLRRQALAETALFTPFGQLAPSTIGQVSTTRGKSGMFT